VVCAKLGVAMDTVRAVSGIRSDLFREFLRVRSDSRIEKLDQVSTLCREFSIVM